MKMDDAAKIGDVFITTTGMKDVIVGRHFYICLTCLVDRREL